MEGRHFTGMFVSRLLKPFICILLYVCLKTIKHGTQLLTFFGYPQLLLFLLFSSKLDIIIVSFKNLMRTNLRHRLSIPQEKECIDHSRCWLETNYTERNIGLNLLPKYQFEARIPIGWSKCIFCRVRARISRWGCQSHVCSPPNKDKTLANCSLVDEKSRTKQENGNCYVDKCYSETKTF